MDRGAWWTIVCGVAKESDRAEQINSKCIQYTQWARDCAKDLLSDWCAFSLLIRMKNLSNRYVLSLISLYRWGNQGIKRFSNLRFPIVNGTSGLQPWQLDPGTLVSIIIATLLCYF